MKICHYLPIINYSIFLIYIIVSQEFWPLAKMDKTFQIEIPLIQSNKRKKLIEELRKIVKILEYINHNILINIQLIEKTKYIKEPLTNWNQTIFMCGIPFRVIENPYYVNMIKNL